MTEPTAPAAAPRVDPKVDAACADAVDVAREHLEAEVGADVVGEHLAVRREGERLVSHVFTSTQPGYRGWTWSVTITRASRQKSVTVCEVVLLPGDGALVAPAWTPYKERVRPGDLSPGDLLPPEEDDLRLAPGWFDGDPATEPLVDESTARPVANEVGLGRPWVLSLAGRDLAAERWHEGEAGPETPLAQQAPAPCAGCGFLVRLAGPLGTEFGVCANGMANDDGRVVALDHGCGAHSEARLSRSASAPALPPPVFDTLSTDDL